MPSLFLWSGLLLLTIVGIDVIWTTLGTHGGGPITRHYTSGLWRIALAMHRRVHKHRLLSFAGSGILLLTVMFWVAMMWLAWTLVYCSDPHAIVDGHTKQPADLAGRAYFVAYSISTMGNGDLQPNGSGWRIVTGIMTLSGIAGVTLVTTFILSVLGAVVQGRALGAYISDMGGTPRRIIERAWTGEEFDSLEQHLVQITAMLHLYTEEHLAYPVVQYFHSENRRTAATLRIAALKQVVLLIAEGVAPEKRLPRMVVEPLRDAFRGFMETVEGEFASAAEEAPRDPSLAILREIGIPTVSEETFHEAVAREDAVRRFLLGLVEGDGWTWEDTRR
ncbi:MAG: potassium channel family protein [Acidobacteriota bacterium]|nr:potassium channel family protein [Acidobacteriota bacterium]